MKKYKYNGKIYCDEKLDIDKLTSHGIIVKQNEYGVVIVPYEGYKEYWAMHEGDLK